ncbi:MAG: hypothetical protein MI740_00370 [Halanaerobiales bacterium]|nr:hypothetical protein [Halanaerobiales bacterium]
MSEKELLNQILGELKNLKQGQDELRTAVSELKSDVKKLQRKTDSIFEETGGLLEFKTEMNAKITIIGKKVNRHETDIQLLKKVVSK